jgi:ubiquinone/menaquinone biosynthesis C-methylase UbiE
MPIIDHFGFIAPYYDRVFKPGNLEDLITLAALPPDGMVLDAGGGTGRMAQYLRDKVAQVVVADLSYEMLVQAQAKDGLLTACSHTEWLPFKDQCFDRIVMIDALHHVCHQGETIKELWRLVKPGGRIVVEEPDVRTWGVKWLALGEKVLGMRSHFLAPPAIAALFDRSAQIHIERKGVISWVVVDKPKD